MIFKKGDLCPRPKSLPEVLFWGKPKLRHASASMMGGFVCFVVLFCFVVEHSERKLLLC